MPALDATIELAALAAAAAGAASAYLMAGRLDEVPSLDDAERQPTALRLLRAEAVPACARRCARAAARARCTRRCSSPRPPSPPRSEPSSRRSARRPPSPTPFAAADALLEEHARPVAARLVRALERGGGPLTLEAFRRACL
ncbi:MAG: hypothetical protein M5U28_56175 [Sandaracinaceae bacterium]|nr:hypothetical protein [Sandaracinaceae bacterium]